MINCNLNEKENAMKAAKIILKIVILIMTSIWGIIFGIFAPLSIKFGDIVNPIIAEHYIINVWLINSIVCYITGTVLIMLNLYKTAAGFHTVGMIVSFVIYGTFEQLYQGNTEKSPAGLYMPIIFVTLLTLALAVIANWGKIMAKLNSTNEKKYEASPSILGGTFKYEDKKGASKNAKSAGKKGKK